MGARRRAARQSDLVSRGGRHPRWGCGQGARPGNRHRAVFVPEIKEPKGQVVAGVGGRHAVRQVLLTHMAFFATSIRVIGTKTNNSPAANCRERHATGGDKRHPARKSAPPVVHGGALYYNYPLAVKTTGKSRVERSAPRRVRPLGLRLPSKRASPFFGGYPSSNRTCSFPAYGFPCGTGFISFAPRRPSAPFHIDSDGCSSIWTSGFRRAAT